MPHTFVLVHGAWHGGWCWRRVADLLEKQGHKVFTPTLTGVGERSHLVHPLQFLFLLNENSQRSALKVRFGLWLYHRLSGKKSGPVSEMDLARVHRALDHSTGPLESDLVCGEPPRHLGRQKIVRQLDPRSAVLPPASTALAAP